MIFFVYSLRMQAWLAHNHTGTSEFAQAGEFFLDDIKHLLKRRNHEGNPEYIPVRKEDLDADGW